MPESLLGRVITAGTNPGDLVLDPMCGSGTTPAVAKSLGRRYLGIDISERYAEAARERCGAINPTPT
jgi:DNA modification methylase